jgi:very-short-patch-repair endonuclease
MTQFCNRVSKLKKGDSVRNNMQRAEFMVRERLRNRWVDGYKFRRQYSVGAFVIDFYCSELKLAIEVMQR